MGHLGEFAAGGVSAFGRTRSLQPMAQPGGSIPKRSCTVVYSFLRLDRSDSTKSLRVMLNTRSLVRRNLADEAPSLLLLRDQRQQTPTAAERLPKQFSDASLSKATVKAKRKVLNVVQQQLNSLGVQRRLGTEQPEQQQQQESSSSSSTAAFQPTPLTGAAGDVASAGSEPNNSADVIMELVLEGNSVADFAGALMLLLECGQHEEQVITAGSMFLKRRSSAAAKQGQQAGIQDVVLCMALAHGQLAMKSIGGDAYTLTSGGPAAAAAAMGAELNQQQGVAGDAAEPAPSSDAAALEAAYGHVSDALKLLREHSSSSGGVDAGSGPVRLQLLDVLLRVAPMHAMHLLGGFSDDASAAVPSKQQRERAVEVVKQALWQLEGPEQRLELLGQVRQWLTAAEQITLYDDASVPEQELSEQELYDTALACIWDGYTQRWPHHVYRADSLLERISQRKHLDVDVTLERNVCALLLGKESEAQGQLVAAHQGPASFTASTDGEDAVGAEEGSAAAAAPAAAERAREQLRQAARTKREGTLKGTGAQKMRRRSHPEQLQLGAADSAFVVMEPTDNVQDELSVLEDWAERWLELSVMPGFRALTPGASSSSSPETKPQQMVSVRSYLSSPKVVVFNQVLRYANEQQLRHVTENLQHLSHEKLQQLLTLWHMGTSTLAHSVMRPPKEQQQQQQEKGAGGQPAVPEARLELGRGDVPGNGGREEEGQVQRRASVDSQTAAESRGAAGTDSAKLDPAASTSATRPSAAAAGATASSSAEAAGGRGEPVSGSSSPSPSASAPLPPFKLGGVPVQLDLGVAGAAGGATPLSMTSSMEEAVQEWSSGSRQGGENDDEVAIEALPWVQMGASAGSGEEAVQGAGEGERSRSSEEEAEEARLRGRGVNEAPSLWVVGPRGAIQPRISARIVDPTQSHGGAAHVGAGWRAWARTVGVAALVVVAAVGAGAAWMGGRRFGGSHGLGLAGKVPEAVVQQRQGMVAAWSRLRSDAGPVQLPSSAADIQKAIVTAHAEAHGSSLTPTAARTFLLSWYAASRCPSAEVQPLLPLLLEGTGLKEAKQASARLAKQQQGKGAGVSQAGVRAEVVDVKQEAGRSEAMVRARVWSQQPGATQPAAQELSLEMRCEVSASNGRPLGPWRISSVKQL